MIRSALFAGKWYPKTRQEIEKYLDLKTQKTTAISCICPHAGWMYSGKTAGKVYSGLESADTYVIIGPNHTGNGARASIFPANENSVWRTPLGDAEIDVDFSKALMKYSEFLKEDIDAHAKEHCIEVQVPFIQYFSPRAKIVPVLLMSNEADVAKDMANAVAETVKKSGKKVLIVASTDMTHYEPYEYAKKLDAMAIEKILALDALGLLRTVNQNGISMCGVLPTAAVLLASKKLGAKSAKLIQYSTSGDVSGDRDSVVGYAGIAVA